MCQCHPERVISCPWIRKQQLLSKQSSANLQFRNLWNCQNVFPRIIVLRQFADCDFHHRSCRKLRRADQKQTMAEAVRSNSDCCKGYPRYLQHVRRWISSFLSSLFYSMKHNKIIISLDCLSLFVFPNSYSCNSGMFLSFRSNLDTLYIISRHKECLDSSNNHKKKRTIFTFENSFQFLWQKRRNSNNFHSSKYCSSSAGLVRSNSRRSSSF